MPSVLMAAINWEKAWEHVMFLLPLLVPLALGALSLYMLLPRPEPLPTLWGAITGVVALVLGGIFVVRADILGIGRPDNLIENILFYLFSLGAIVSGVLLVTQSNPARGALCFTLVVLSTCGLFLLLAAPFLMAATIIIYAGAIVVTFLFVLMLASQAGRNDADSRSREPAFAVLTGLVLLTAILYVLRVGNAETKGQDKAEVDKTDTELAALVEKVQEARTQETYAGLIAKVEGPGAPRDSLFDEVGNAAEKHQLLALKQLATGKLQDEWGTARPLGKREPTAVELEKLRQTLAILEASIASTRTELQHRQTYQYQKAGLLYLTADKEGDASAIAVANQPFSDLSGTSVGVAPSQIRRDSEGRPMMPADNAGALGKSLFTDYLVPVELGGLLLLIATVGAIAIAHRHQTPGRAS